MSKEQKVGLFFLMGVILSAIAIEVTVGGGILGKHYHLYVEYPDVGGLKVGDPVRVAGVRMGKVDQIEIRPENVRVRLSLSRDAQVRRDSVARLDFQPMSGSRFISISLGGPSSPVLDEGAVLTSEQLPTLADALGELQKVGQSITNLADSLNRNQEQVMENVNRLIEDNRESVQGILISFRSIAEKLDAGEGTVGKLVNDPALYDQAEHFFRDADLVLRDLRRVSSRMAEGKGSIGRLLADDGLYDEVRETVAGLNRTAENFEALSEDIRNGQGTIGRLMTDDSLYLEAQQAVRGLDRAATGIEDQGPISVLGTMVSTIF